MRFNSLIPRTTARYISNESLDNISSVDYKYSDNTVITQLSNGKYEEKTTNVASTAQKDVEVLPQDPTNNGPIRYNEYGIQMISEHLRSKLFNNKINVNKKSFEKCLKDLKQFNLGERREPFPVTDFNLPKLSGKTVEEHFFNIGLEQSQPYKLLVDSLLIKLPELPTSWVFQSGWTRYKDGNIEQVPYPPDDALLFDVEVCKVEGEMPTIATAVSKDAWYGWVSCHLALGTKLFSSDNYSTSSLIPLESNADNGKMQISKRLFNKHRIVIGHNVSFDRSRVKEQYWLHKSKLRFLDTLSLHVCVSGITSYQKSLLKAGVEGEDEWSKLSSLNSLTKVHKLYCGSEISKEERELFLCGSITDIRNNFQSVMNYCASDVAATHAVLQKLWPLFIERFPHPVTLAGMLELQTAYIPVNKKWNKYIADSNSAYDDLALEAKCLLSQTAKSTCKLLHGKLYEKDLWMWDQNWTTKHIKMKRTHSPKIDEQQLFFNLDQASSDSLINKQMNELTDKFQSVLKTRHNLPQRKIILPGYPEWYRKICSKPNEPGWVPGPTLITNSMQVAPKLLKLTWKGMPLHYIRGSGWGYISPTKSQTRFSDTHFPLDIFNDFVEKLKGHDLRFSDSCDDDTGLLIDESETNISFIKLPHKDGSNFNVGNPLAQDYINKFSDTGFSGSLTNAQRIIAISKMLSYWRNNKERIESQLVCWLTKKESLYFVNDDKSCLGAILPLIIVCGTLTRRAVEPTWMTVSNSVIDRIGSEFRGIVEAPPGYCFVGADVDSQELWIASLLGDAYSARSHGCTPFGWMTLNGHKSDKSDLHSVTAKAVGISRNHAKILNYARIYGSGQKFAERTLLNFNPGMTPSEATNKASKMYQLTKGKKMFVLKDYILPQIKQRSYSKYHAANICKIYGKNINDLFEDTQWAGGTESEMFNSLECIANQRAPETPFLKSKLSRALVPDIDSDEKHGNTRINWVVQSSAVDFLHLMLVCMNWLLDDSSRFSLSFHDEVHYLVPKESRYKVALALQITNLLTRTFCVSRVNMTDLPLSVAFFSTVEIDTVLRKDPLDDNKTPSNPYGLKKGYGIPSGESLTIDQCLKKLLQTTK